MKKIGYLCCTPTLLVTAFFLSLGIISQGKVAIGSELPNRQPASSVQSPKLAIQFGIVSTDNPNGELSSTQPLSATFGAPGSMPSWTGTLNSQELAATPIDAAAQSLDGNDWVTFAVVVENMGGGSTKLSDIQLQAAMPQESITATQSFIPQETNLQVRNGAGESLLAEALDGGLFGGGIVINHPNEDESALAAFDATSGENLAIVTFDLNLPATVTPASLFPFAIRITGYSFQEDGGGVVGEFPLTAIRAQTEISTTSPVLTSRILGTSLIHDDSILNDELLADATPLTIGEIITYEVTVMLPEGESEEGFLKSEMDRGFALVDVLSVTASENVTTDRPGGFAAVKDSVRLIELNPPRPNQGQKFDLFFGTITVSNDGQDPADNTAPESRAAHAPNQPGYLTMRYRVVTLNNGINQQGEEPLLRNQYLQWCWTAQHYMVASNTPDSYIVEPDLTIRQTIAPTQPLPGELITVTLSVEHSASSAATAYDLELADLLPAELRYVPRSLRWLDPGSQPDSWSVENFPVEDDVVEPIGQMTNIRVHWDELPVGEARIVQFMTRLTHTHLPPSLIERRVDVVHSPAVLWSSMPGHDNQALSTYHDLSSERTGDIRNVGELLNTYLDEDNRTLSMNVPATAPDQARIEAELAVENLSRTEGAVQPGDRLRYNLVIRNSGTARARNVTLINRLEENLLLDDKSIVLSQGSLLSPTAEATTAQSLLKASLGQISLTEVVTVVYEVVVASPLSNGTSQLANQALLQGDNFVLTVSNDPTTVEQLDPTVLMTSNAPQLVAFNQARLKVDADQNQRISAGDSVEYEIDIINRGHAVAKEVIFYNNIGNEAVLLPDSLAGITETIVTGAEPGQSSLRVDLGDLPVGESKTLRFSTVVNGLQLSGIQRVDNQGVVVAANHPAILTDDPTTLRRADPTTVSLVAAPEIRASKTYHLVVDSDGNGYASPGDTIGYRIMLSNSGVFSATEVIFEDLLADNTSFVAGSLRTSRIDASAVQLGQDGASGDEAAGLQVLLPTMDASGAFDSDTLNISYLVKLAKDDANTVPITGQGLISSSELPVVATHDPLRSIRNSATETFIGLVPQVDVLKQAVLLIDHNRDGLLTPPLDESPADRLLYQLELRNLGNTPATSIVLDDLLDENLRLIPESVRTNRGQIVVGTSADSKSVLVEVGPLNRQQTSGAAEGATISFEVELIGGERPEQVENWAKTLISIDNRETDLNAQYNVRSDDPNTITRGDATITPVTQLPTPLRPSDEPNGTGGDSPSDLVEPTIYLPLLTN